MEILKRLKMITVNAVYFFIHFEIYTTIQSEAALSASLICPVISFPFPTLWPKITFYLINLMRV